VPHVTIDRWIDRYAARIRLGEFLQRAAEWGAAYLFVFGAAVLVVKLFFPQAWPHVLWLAAGLIPAFAAGWPFRANRENRWQSVARLDASLETGGLLMTLSERPDADWAAHLPQLDQYWQEALPRIRPRRFASYLALPLAFAVGACFVPLRQAATATPLLNSVGQQAARDLEELLEEIEKDQVLEEEEQRKLQEEVRKLAEETRDTPLTHEKWETVDALRERMKVRLESAAMSVAQARDAAAMLAESHRPDAPEFSVERVEQLDKQLAEALQKMMQKGAFAGAPKELQDELRRLTKNGKFKMPQDPRERQELLDELRDYLDQESSKLAELREKCSGCKSGRCQGDGECEGGQCLANGNKSGNRPGRGGVTRGRGDADLTWGDEADKQGTKFKETVLPKGFLDQPKDEVVGIQKTAPSGETAEQARRAPRRELDPAAGEATWNRRLNPRHRNAVRRYFDSQESKTSNE
jgi:hypothetical protein